MKARLISIIGPPGAGKTTLAQALAAELPAMLLCEPYAQNPFLEAACAGDASARLPGQVFFLVSRAGQLSRRTWPAGGWVVSDYAYCQDRVFAEMSLTGEDLRVYDGLAARFEPDIVSPDVLIHLDADVPVLLDRIARRGRPFERNLGGDKLVGLRSAYARLMACAACRVLSVDTAASDLRDAATRRELIARVVASHRGNGE